ncbi:hypothetical protein C7S18_03825 [Ahniella affigens]|uniref:Uncharacterized protein n=1 Tax=Ahniella affigens TaxID=2021234 RepID=A0A2P1PNF9_9GAMM|nr:hypothetical protein C7S18_03825 [Ahniella affigens]
MRFVIQTGSDDSSVSGFCKPSPKMPRRIKPDSIRVRQADCSLIDRPSRYGTGPDGRHEGAPLS